MPMSALSAAHVYMYWAGMPVHAKLPQSSISKKENPEGFVKDNY